MEVYVGIKVLIRPLILTHAIIFPSKLKESIKAFAWFFIATFAILCTSKKLIITCVGFNEL
jgi:hypothetical protein